MDLNYQKALLVLSKIRDFYLGIGAYDFSVIRNYEDRDEAISEAWINIHSEIKEILDYDKGIKR
jgi:uncharacterized protein with GYD domain